VSDRFTTRLDTLATGNYRLAAIDVASGQVRALPSFENGKNINPQWAPGSQALYFVSDASGVSNVYRLELPGGDLRQLTDLVTGVSGITALSPTLSAAANSNKLVYSAYDEGRYEIYTIQDEDKLAGWPVRPGATRNAGLIPGGRPIGEVLQATNDATTGLAGTDTFKKEPYKAKLGLDYIGQPYVAAGVDRYGTAFGGGISMSFSDMLGEHSLDTMIQANSIQGFTDLGAVAAYVNRVHRFNWGAQVAQVPYITGGFQQGVTTINGQRVYQEQTLLFRQVERSVGLLGFYPFNSSFRLEAQTGFRRIGFDEQLTTDNYSLATGQYLGTDKQKLDTIGAVSMYNTSAALVRDTSVFGATSPIMGQRFRFEVSPVLGTLKYTGVLADFRQYLMPVRPLTLAARVMHYARYGSGGGDQRLYPLFVGYQSLVRGYDTNSFDVSECGPDLERTGSCPVYDRLLGTRLLVANLEARIPLFALFGAKNLYGPVPIEIGAFFDSGVAWDTGSKPKLFGGDRQMIRSVGATARLNLFGYAVLELDYAKPLDRPGKKPFFQFNLQTGF